jgi:putative membrane protein
MSEEQYDRYTADEKHQMILRDYLAVDRTIMANESSFLAYIRTALTLLVAAITMLKFLDSTVFHILGWVFMACAILLVLHGATRYDAMERILDRLTGVMKSSPNAVHASLAKRCLIASQSLISLFR